MVLSFKEDELPYVEKAERYCSVSEQCITSARAKLISWGLDRVLIERIIEHLCAKDFVNERRYAFAYSDAKLNSQRWGRVKIAFQLRAKHLPKNLVDEAVASIDPEQYRKVLTNLATVKWENYKEPNIARGRQKLIVFLQSKGFELDIIQEVLSEINLEA